MISMRSRAAGTSLQTVSLIGAVLLAMAAFAPVAVADDAPPVVVGGGGALGTITVTATSPGSSGGGGGHGGGGSPVGNGTGSSSGGSSSGGGSPSSGGGSSSGGSGGGGSDVPTGPSLDGYGSTMCGQSTGFASTCSGLLAGSGGPTVDPYAFLNGSGSLLCGLGQTGACPAPGAPAAPAAPAAPGAPPAAPPPPPPPAPAVVAQIAISRLGLKAATPHLSANPNTAVGLPVWLWVDRSPQMTGPMSTTATAGPTSVTATASLSKVIWSMGQPGGEVACSGPGTPAPGGPLFAGDNSPDCGYAYTLRSLKERTGGTGKWPVTVASVWSITWFGGGQFGAQGLNLTANTAVEVGELQAVVVPGGGH